MPACIEGIDPVPEKKTVVVRVGPDEWEIGQEAATELGLCAGLPLTPVLRQGLDRASERRQAAAQVLGYLRGRARTSWEVGRYLQDRGHAEEVVLSVQEELVRQGLVDDARYADWFVEARLFHRPTGVARLVSEMCERGVPQNLAEDAAIRGVGPHEEALAVRAAQSRLASARRLGPERGLGRLARFLLQRGFTEETVRVVCARFFNRDVPLESPPSTRHQDPTL